MKQVLLKQGEAIVENVPMPVVQPGCVLVQVLYSCISVGTELSGLKMSGEPLWRRALKQPHHVKKVLKMIASSGLRRTRSVVKGMLEGGQATGYSAAGVVMAVGENVDQFQVGDKVACAGAQWAHHAEVISVPTNLTVKIPEKLSFQEASTVTLGAIALQGVRRAQPTLGETFVVVGCGILGQLTVQLLRAHGAQVIAVDVDPQRVSLALSQGAEVGVDASQPSADHLENIFRLTEGVGADGVIITASTPSHQLVSQAFQWCRKKGRVVLVGDVGLHLNRRDLYEKELDFFISCSYGPGRYDRHYEEEGLDYPVGYVRWTENRNMSAYLRFLAEKRISLKGWLENVFSVEEAPAAYKTLQEPEKKPLLVLLRYAASLHQEGTRVENAASRSASPQQVRIALIGAGMFSKVMHLPNLSGLSSCHLQAVMSRSGHNAMATAKQFGAQYGTTDIQKIVNDPDIDAVIIATRHDLHAGLALAALQAGKHVFVEKPLAMNESELKMIEQFYQDHPQSPLLLTDFNRRFSPIVQRMLTVVKVRTNPMIINYRMNAGYLPLDHWVHAKEGGGRNIGEACHIYDLFVALTGACVTAIKALSIRPQKNYYTYRDNFVVSLRFEEGSVANLIYTALGDNKSFAKEQCEIFVDGKVLSMNDYQTLKISSSRLKGMDGKIQNKGHFEALEAFVRCIKEGSLWPIPLWQQGEAMRIAFEVEKQLPVSQEEIACAVS